MNNTLFFVALLTGLMTSLMSVAETEAQTSTPAAANVEQRLQVLEQRLKAAEQEAADAQARFEDLEVAFSQQGNQQSANSFNPSIGLILNAKAIYQDNKGEDFSIPGIWLPAESGYGDDGLQLGESELNLSSNVDDKFFAGITIAFGEETEVEEAYLQTTALPAGLKLKFGRLFSNIGYLNNHHAHSDNFSQRPLAYQALLGGQYADDGLQLSWLAPSDMYWESGVEVFRGEAFPAAGAANNGLGSWTAFSHIGGDIGFDHSWRAGISFLNAKVEDRQNDIGESYSGDSELWMIDAIWKWAPEGNSSITNASLQAEYLQRNEKGEATTETAGLQTLNTDTTGWYVQAVYQFMPRWRVGMRHEQMALDAVTAPLQGSSLDPLGNKPKATSLMLDWSNSEFSRFRLQFTDDQASPNNNNIVTLQYIAAFGAHGGHSF